MRFISDRPASVRPSGYGASSAEDFGRIFVPFKSNEERSAAFEETVVWLAELTRDYQRLLVASAGLGVLTELALKAPEVVEPPLHRSAVAYLTGDGQGLFASTSGLVKVANLEGNLAETTDPVALRLTAAKIVTKAEGRLKARPGQL